MKERYYIMDSESHRFYCGSDYLPWISNAFTSEPEYAICYTNKKVAKLDVERFTKNKTEFDGNTPLKKGRLVVVQMSFQMV